MNVNIVPFQSIKKTIDDISWYFQEHGMILFDKILQVEEII